MVKITDIEEFRERQEQRRDTEKRLDIESRLISAMDDFWELMRAGKADGLIGVVAVAVIRDEDDQVVAVSHGSVPNHRHGVLQAAHDVIARQARQGGSYVCGPQEGD